MRPVAASGPGRAARLIWSAVASPSGLVILTASGLASAALLSGRASLGITAVLIAAIGVLYRFARQEAAARSRLERLSTALDLANAAVAEMEVRTADQLQVLRDRESALAGRVEDLESTARTISRDVAKANQQIENHRESLTVVRARITRERSQRIVGVARATSSPQGPQRVTLIVSIHRAGSTLLLDLFRSQAGVDLWPSAELWHDLNLTGRRYPADLSDGSDGVVGVEVASGEGALVPPMGYAGPYERPTVAIEKLHPEFYDFDHTDFADRVEALRRHHPVGVVYLVRRPLDAMWSMVEYKRRNPQWYSALSEAEVPERIRRSLGSMVDLRHRLPGLVLDYEQLVPGDSSLISVLAESVGASRDGVASSTEQAFRVLGRDVRAASTAGAFLGKRDENRAPEGPDGSWVDLRGVLSSADALYRQLSPRLDAQNSESKSTRSSTSS